jgi:hypothetical protein
MRHTALTKPNPVPAETTYNFVGEPMGNIAGSPELWNINEAYRHCD